MEMLGCLTRNVSMRTKETLNREKGSTFSNIGRFLAYRFNRTGLIRSVEGNVSQC